MRDRSSKAVDWIIDRANSIPANVTLGLSIIGLIGVVVLLVIVVPLSARVAQQAQAGDAARNRQIQVAPMGCALANDLYERGKIGYDLLVTYTKNAPDRCSIPPRGR